MHLHFTVQVPKASTLDHQIDHLRAKIERLLAVFQPELVQLHGRLARGSAREGVLCSLTLSLPTGRLAAEDAAENAQIALRQAGEALVEQIKKHKQRLQREQRPAGHRSVRTMPAADELPPAPASGAVARRDLSAYIAANVDQLRRFVARQLRLRERWGQLRPRQLDPREVLDEMIAEALASPNGDHPQPPRWFYVLAVAAIHRLAEQSDQFYLGSTSDSLDRELTEGERRREEEEFENFSPLEEPELGDITPDAATANPEELAYSNEVVSWLQTALARLPPRLREDLVLFAIEGFSLDELALLSHRQPAQVRRDIGQANERLAALQDLPGELRNLLVEQTRRKLSSAA